MSITVPTAEDRGSDPSSPSPPRRWPRWVVLAGIVVGLVSVLGDEEPSSPPQVGEIAAPAAALAGPVTADPPVTDVLRWTRFPGQGAFTGIATSANGGTAVGQKVFPGPGGFVWTARSDLGEWAQAAIESEEHAVLSTVVPYIGGFVVGGAVIEPATGISMPTLWFGVPGSNFSILDHPFPGPGRVDSLHSIDGELVLIGQASGPFADQLRPGDARSGRVLSGRPGNWRDITPPGISVLVMDVIDLGGTGWLAVGGTADGGVMWHSTDRGEVWHEVTWSGLVGAVVTDVVGHGDGSLTAVARRAFDDGTVRAEVLRSTTSPFVWYAASVLGVGDVGWLMAVDDGVIGGAYNTVGALGDAGLWGHRTSDGWRRILDDGAPRAAAGGLLVGGLGSHPVMWSYGHEAPTPVPVVESGEPAWELVGAAPHGAIVDTGSRLFALAGERERTTLWVADSGRDWRRVDLPANFLVGGYGEAPDGIVVWGSIGRSRWLTGGWQLTDGRDGEVLDIADDGTRRARRTLADTTIEHVTTREDTLYVFGVGPDGPVRHAFPPPGDVSRATMLTALPAGIVEVGELLIGSVGVGPGPGAMVSGDLGETWAELRLPVAAVGMSGDDVVLITSRTPQRMFVLDPVGYDLTPVAAAPPNGLESSGPQSRFVWWAGGVASLIDHGVRLLPGLGEVAFSIPADPWSGFDYPIDVLVQGPRGFVRTVDDRLFRWIGPSDGP